MPCTPVPTSPAHNPGPAPRRRVRRSRLPPRAVLAPPRGAAHPYPGFPRAASQGGASGLILESQSQASPTRPARYPGGAMEPRVVADAVETGEEDVIMEALRTYNRENSQSFTFDDAQQEDRKRLAELLVAVLERGLPPSRRVTWLQSIRILTRDRSCLEPFTSRQSLQALASYAGIALEGSVPEPLDMDVVLESLKCLCNLVLSSPVAQVLAAEARLVVRLAERVGLYHKSSFPHEVQFFDLRLLFLLTALRTDARQQLFQELQGVRLLTAALELTLGMTPDGGPPELLPPQETERAMEILKVLFNITFDSIKREVDEEDAALYRHLGTILRHCMMVAAAGDRTEEFHGHTVNLLGNLPLKCLDVLLTLEPHEGSLEFLGANMDVIHVLLSFLEKRLHQVGRGTYRVGTSVALTFPSSCGPCFFTVPTGKWRSA
ncbi:synembryn-a isoform 2 [Lynx pardinus]|uniref:Synembryn n=1 Tax=Lynx pardinus TaxID=191816 RepID=A0A485PPT1_LYNPA|nr:synembryn-a isoform 2 [Lynx pardinus]